MACGIFTVLSRTYLYNYYIGAHIALMAIFVAIFVISHHIFKVRRLLHHREKTFLIWQCVVNSWYLACCLIMALGYSVLSGMAIHTNYDYVTGLVLSWCTTGLMTYLCVLVYHRAWTERTCRQGASDPQRMDEARGKCFIFGALDRGSQCHVLILRNNNVALSNLRTGHVTLSNLRNCHVPCHYLLKTHVACH